MVCMTCSENLLQYRLPFLAFMTINYNLTYSFKSCDRYNKDLRRISLLFLLRVCFDKKGRVLLIAVGVPTIISYWLTRHLNIYMLITFMIFVFFLFEITMNCNVN